MTENAFNREDLPGGTLGQIAAQIKLSLGNIHSALERLAPVELREEQDRMDMDAAVLLQSYYRLLRLAGNLEAASQLEGPSCAQLRNDDIVSVCRTVMDKAQLPAELLGLTLSFHSDTTHQIIAMDTGRIERLLLNLLSNAFKFTPRGGKISLEVKVSLRWVELRLADTGCGIPKALSASVFDLYRQNGTVEPPPHGLGLGLPICRRIAQEHNGSLLLSSQEGQGTTVLVSLPNRKAALQELRSCVADYTGGFNPTLLELADALPRQAFTRQFLD